MTRPRDWDAKTYQALDVPHEEWANGILDRLDLNGDERVLDAGCGSGRVTQLLLDRLPDTELPLAEIPWPPLKGQPLKERFGVLEPLPKFEVPADMPVVEHKDNWD